MKSRIPADAFERYVAMGLEQRSYQALADALGVSKCAIVKCAKREGWTERLNKIEADARDISDRKLTETIAAMHERHANTLKLIHVKAVEALRDIPFDSTADAVKACEMVIRSERVMAGEAAKRGEENIAEIMKREMHLFLKVERPEPEPQLIEATVVDAVADDAEIEDAG